MATNPLHSLGGFLTQLETDLGSLAEGVTGVQLARWNPRLDLHETASSVIVTVDLPGFRKEDLVIEQVGRRLVVTGTRNISRESSAGQWHHQERHTGEIRREVLLPESVNLESEMSANYSTGVLTVTLPKTTETRSRTIPIN